MARTLAVALRASHLGAPSHAICTTWQHGSAERHCSGAQSSTARTLQRLTDTVRFKTTDTVRSTEGKRDTRGRLPLVAEGEKSRPPPWSPRPLPRRFIRSAPLDRLVPLQRMYGSRPVDSAEWGVDPARGKRPGERATLAASQPASSDVVLGSRCTSLSRHTTTTPAQLAPLAEGALRPAPPVPVHRRGMGVRRHRGQPASSSALPCSAPNSAADHNPPVILTLVGTWPRAPCVSSSVRRPGYCPRAPIGSSNHPSRRPDLLSARISTLSPAAAYGQQQQQQQHQHEQQQQQQQQQQP
ncbi:hypothetical protein CDD80_556 [Ophiocordyceps camponoti-rufipedis]|uniref:Uncharacterized protein n=1 Tax=Ophiocordyceps camponoti-rufipedis TaxID=2004952 RepID=A0A2C5YE22_9HYPO|nr:hypothetical protein CDD80_556 [Ophiocordyceps camponoti-rufipedis]